MLPRVIFLTGCELLEKGADVAKDRPSKSQLAPPGPISQDQVYAPADWIRIAAGGERLKDLDSPKNLFDSIWRLSSAKNVEKSLACQDLSRFNQYFAVALPCWVAQTAGFINRFRAKDPQKKQGVDIRRNPTESLQQTLSVKR